jgi:Ca-activated chloride channel family protein
LLEANRDGLNGLIAYAGQSFVVAPLTEDASALNDLLEALAPDTMPVDGDDAAAAIAQGVELIGHAKAGGGSLVLITDQADATAISAARQALAAGVHVSVLGVGTAQGAPLPNGDGSFVRDARGEIMLAPRDERALSALAAAGGGRYVGLSDGSADIEALSAQLRAAQPATLSTQNGGDEWQDRGPWLLLLLLPLAALAFRRGWLLMLPLLLAPTLWSAPAQAGGWRDLWLRADQQAAQALQQGKPQQAQQLARDPALRGAAAYRAGDYAAAAEALQQAGGSETDYNLGNAQAKQGDYHAAIDAYDRALKRDPRNADALANRQAVEDWLKQHPPKDNPDNRGQGGKGGQNSKGSPNQQSPSSGQPSQGQGQQGQQDQQGQQQDQQQGQQQGQQGQDQNSAGASTQGRDPSQDRSGKPDGQSGQGTPANAPPPTAQQQAEQQAKTTQAQQALRQQLDQALAAKGKSGQAHQLGTLDADDPQSKLPPELRQALQRVPDDPGALLRRKFELEYRQRQGDAAPEDAQP